MTKRVIAAFDFDGTLSRCDLLLPFLFFSFPFFKVISGLFLLVPTFLGFLTKSLSRQVVKERILTRFFAGQSEKELFRLGETFSSSRLESYLYPDALKRVEWHQSQGHCCIVVTASTPFYLKHWTKRRGFNHLISSELEVNPEGKITGRLIGKNCWGEEKVERLLNLVGKRESFILYAYGNGLGDRPLLSIADFAYYRFFDRL